MAISFKSSYLSIETSQFEVYCQAFNFSCKFLEPYEGYVTLKIKVEKLVLDVPLSGYVQKGNVLTQRGSYLVKTLEPPSTTESIT